MKEMKGIRCSIAKLSTSGKHVAESHRDEMSVRAAVSLQ
jgi:hypothetical protein